MLHYSQDPPGHGYSLNLGNAVEALAPPDYHSISPDEYRGFLRASYRRSARPFLDLARRARAHDLTLVSHDRPDLVAVLWEAVVAVGRRHNLNVAGQWVPSKPKSTRGEYVPPAHSPSL